MGSAKSRSRSLHGPGSSAARADSSCLVGGRAVLLAVASPVSASRSMPGSSSELLDHPHEKNDSPVLHKCGISPRCTETSTTEGEGGVQCAGLGLFPSIFRLISLTRAPQGLVILVISSTRGSIAAASGQPNNAERKLRKKMAATTICHHAHTTGGTGRQP